MPEKQTFNVGTALNFGNQQAQYGQLNNNQQQNIFNSNQQQQAVGNYAVNNNNQLFTNQNQNQVFNNNQQQAVGNYAINNNNPIRNNNQVLNNPNNNIVFSNQNQNQVINNNNQQDQYGKPVSNPVGPNNINNVNSQSQRLTGLTSITNSNNQFQPSINLGNPANAVTNIDPNPISFISNDLSGQTNPFLRATPEKLLLQESRQQQVRKIYNTYAGTTIKVISTNVEFWSNQLLIEYKCINILHKQGFS